jgi:hypothetical protein
MMLTLTPRAGSLISLEGFTFVVLNEQEGASVLPSHQSCFPAVRAGRGAFFLTWLLIRLPVAFPSPAPQAV